MNIIARLEFELNLRPHSTTLATTLPKRPQSDIRRKFRPQKVAWYASIWPFLYIRFFETFAVITSGIIRDDEYSCCKNLWLKISWRSLTQFEVWAKSGGTKTFIQHLVKLCTLVYFYTHMKKRCNILDRFLEGDLRPVLWVIDNHYNTNKNLIV